MGEVHIRINKRAFERTLFTIVIIALAVLLFFKWDSAAVVQPDVNVAELEEQVQTLQAANEQLEADLTEAERQLNLIDEAAQERQDAVDSAEPKSDSQPTPEPEEQTLSGEIESEISVRADGDGLTGVTLVVYNGLESTEEISYLMYWEDYYESTVKVEGDEVISSDETATITLYDGSGFPKTVPDTSTLVVDIRDTDGELLDRLTDII